MLQLGPKPKEERLGAQVGCLVLTLAGKRSTNLVTAIPAVTHEVEGKLLLASLLWRSELQLAGLLLLQRDALDYKTGVVCRPPHQEPPVLLLSPRVPAQQGLQLRACQPEAAFAYSHAVLSNKTQTGLTVAAGQLGA